MFTSLQPRSPSLRTSRRPRTCRSSRTRPAALRSAGACHRCARRLSVGGMISATLCCSAPALAGDARQPADGLPEVTVSAPHTGPAQLGYTVEAMGTATGLPLAPVQTPQSVSVVTRQQIEDANLPTALDAVLAAPGMAAVRSDSNRYQLSARGFRIDNFQFDGMSSPLLPYWNYGATNMSSALYERVEVVRGATGLMTGNGEPSAAINFIRKQPSGRLAAAGLVGLGSWGERRANADVSLPQLGPQGLRMRLVAEHTDRGSHVSWQGQRAETFYGVVALEATPRTELSVALEYQQDAARGFGSGVPLFYRDGSRTAFDRSASNNTRWARMQTRTTTVLGKLRHRFDNDWQLQLAVDLNGGHYHMRNLFRGEFPDRDSGQGMSQVWRNYDGTRQRRQAQWSLTGPFSLLGRRHQAMLGWSRLVDHSRIDRHREQAPLPDIGSFFDWRSAPIGEPRWLEQTEPADHRRVVQSGAYAAGRFSLAPPLHLILGARLANIEIERDAFGTRQHHRHRHQLIPYLGAVHDFDPTYALYGSYTSIFRAQYAQSTDGSLLAPVEGRSVEAGIKAAWREGALNGSAAIFDTSQRNLAVKIAGAHVRGRPQQQAWRAARGVRVRGIELELAGQVQAGWDLGASFTRFIKRSADGQRLDSTFPSTQFKLFGTYRYSPRLTLGGGGEWRNGIGSTTHQPGGVAWVSQASVMLLDVMARYQLGRGVSLALHVDNLLDRRYYDQVGFHSQGWVGDPRQWRLTLQARY
ncbi:TonB-dependent siderophore receptor [Herbaspirillum sp. YR522]|uniref:TonB-dependent siderophore receptor n=1 Tax=Herbaspirillum sp. YR522 TaxID=1144342 RepID=UPI00026F5CE2|nr:TonB-dependent siderophore receptor [Herbaspirillum sp. YR522]EJM98643.1 TonB-dependent siderophore receptor [Herbaspirillum sp. YR522]